MVIVRPLPGTHVTLKHSKIWLSDPTYGIWSYHFYGPVFTIGERTLAGTSILPERWIVEASSDISMPNVGRWYVLPDMVELAGGPW